MCTLFWSLWISIKHYVKGIFFQKSAACKKKVTYETVPLSLLSIEYLTCLISLLYHLESCRKLFLTLKYSKLLLIHNISYASAASFAIRKQSSINRNGSRAAFQYWEDGVRLFTVVHSRTMQDDRHIEMRDSLLCKEKWGQASSGTGYPERWCGLYTWKHSALNWIKPRATWLDLIVDPALSRHFY